MSSAGLVRYFDSEEEKGPTLDPRTWLALALVTGFIVRAATIMVA